MNSEDEFVARCTSLAHLSIRMAGASHKSDACLDLRQIPIDVNKDQRNLRSALAKHRVWFGVSRVQSRAARCRPLRHRPTELTSQMFFLFKETFRCILATSTRTTQQMLSNNPIVAQQLFYAFATNSHQQICVSCWFHLRY